MIDFSFKDIIDIILVAFMIYYVYKLMKRSSAANIFSGILVFIIVWLIFAKIFDLKLMGTMLNYVVNIGALALVVLFQEEIRRFLSSIGTSGKNNIIINFLRIKKPEEIKHENIIPIIMACINMSREKTGALIIVEKDIRLNEYAQSGEMLDAVVSQPLIENIFFKNTPLHDGAVIIRNNRIVAAGCILPVSHDENIPKHFGLRHRSALGIAEKTDAVAIIVSEETGYISVCQKGKIKENVTADQLEAIISN